MVEEVEVLEYGLKLSGIAVKLIKVERVVVYKAYQKHGQHLLQGISAAIARTDSRLSFWAITAPC